MIVFRQVWAYKKSLMSFLVLTKCAHVFCHEFSLIAPGFNFRASV